MIFGKLAGCLFTPLQQLYDKYHDSHLCVTRLNKYKVHITYHTESSREGAITSKLCMLAQIRRNC